MTMNKAQAEALLRDKITNPHDMTDLVNAVRENDLETIEAIEDRPDVIAAAQIVARTNN